ncbi:ADP-ribosylglycohydrolase family protein [Streptomyces sp. NPDC004008]
MRSPSPSGAPPGATALWATASAGGDVDTTCAIVGGIVASRVGTEGIPRLAARTPVLEHPHTPQRWPIAAPGTGTSS